MRKVIDLQMKIGEQDIADIKFDPKSRDDITKLLRGLQSIYCDRNTRNQIFEILHELISPNINLRTGRGGMNLWKILVLGTLRLDAVGDYDRLLEIANNHKRVRQMLGHGIVDDEYEYKLQTLRDNISLFTPEILDKINQVVVNHGHKIVGKKKDEKLSGSCDTFVVETDVHYPTDINLLFDAIRKIITLLMRICSGMNISDWRQGKHNIKKAKKYYRKAQQMKRSTSKDESKKAERNQLIINAHREYINLAQSYVDKAKETLSSIQPADIIMVLVMESVSTFIKHAERQINQIDRRVVNGETIPHHEKVFSLFEEHTEWISKGKAGVPVELGFKVCIVKDQYNFILHHQVMQKQTDEQIALSIIEETQRRFADFKRCSFDKGFHSPNNQKELPRLLDNVVLPRKGRLSAVNAETENSEEFKKARRKHSAVESSINALGNHGLDRCLDHGLNGFKRYVALGIVARNIQIIGDILQQKERKKLQRKDYLRDAA